MMKNIIRGATFVLVIAMLTGCANAKLYKSRQAHSLTVAGIKETAVEASEKQSAVIARKIREQQQDRTTTVLTREVIPSSETKVDIPVQNLLELPEGAGYTSKEGQVSVNVQKLGNKISVTGKCDSIARQCLFYENEVFRQRGEVDSLRQVISRLEATSSQKDEIHEKGDVMVESLEEKPPATWYKWLLVGFLAGLLVTAPVNKLKNKLLTFLK